jgi:hypothetical protein
MRWSVLSEAFGKSQFSLKAVLIEPVIAQSSYFSEPAKRRSRCGSVRGKPVLNSHFSPGFAPQVGQRTDRASFFLVFMASPCTVVGELTGQ